MITVNATCTGFPADYTAAACVCAGNHSACEAWGATNETHCERNQTAWNCTCTWSDPSATCEDLWDLRSDLSGL